MRPIVAQSRFSAAKAGAAAHKARARAMLRLMIWDLRGGTRVAHGILARRRLHHNPPGARRSPRDAPVVGKRRPFCYSPLASRAQSAGRLRAVAARDVVASRRRAISNKVFVGNLSFDVTREELVEAFGAVGRVRGRQGPDGPGDGTPARLRLRRVRERRGRAEVHRADERPRPQGSRDARERGRGPAAAPGGRARRRRPGLTPAAAAASRAGGGGGFSRPGGGFGRAASPAFPPPEDGPRPRRAWRRFKQKPETKPARKTSPRRRRDDVVDDDDAEY